MKNLIFKTLVIIFLISSCSTENKTILNSDEFKTKNERIENLKKENVLTLAIEQVESAIFLQDFQVEKNQTYALVFGNEVYGVSQEAVAICDGCIEIPQLGTKHSLNISVSAGIVVWDLFQKMNWPK